jgi:mandelate racemase
MQHPELTIRGVRARAVDAPLANPIRTAVGEVPSAPLVLIDVTTEEGVTGRSYLFAYTPVTLRSLVRLIEDLETELVGKSVSPVERMRQLELRFRLVGWQGLIGMAVGALDMALWDALGCAANLPVVSLLGGEVRPLPAYDSYGIIDPLKDAGLLERSVESGFRAIKIKIGGGTLEDDVRVVAATRRVIGPDTRLMVDYNQPQTVTSAIERIRRLSEFDLTWAEEPVGADDLHGHRRVRAGVGAVPIQTGENWWFPRGMANAIAAGASDLAMVDIMKIGGVTGWLNAMGQAEAASLPISSHTFNEPSAHVLAVSPTAHWLEHLDLAGAVLTERLLPQDGMVAPRGPGLGLVWDEKAVVRYAWQSR